MKVYLLYNGSYPGGMAMSNRLHLYCKSMISSGLDVEVIVPSKSKNSKKMCFDGVSYSNIRNPVFIKTVFLRQLNVFFAAFYYAFLCNGFSKKCNILYISGFSWFVASLAIIGAHIGGLKIILEVNENPYAPEGGRLDTVFIRKIRRYFMLNLPYRLADGFVVISGELAKLVNRYKNRNAQIGKIPILVDEEKESKEKLVRPDIPFILHTGSMSETKDGIISVFEGYAKAYTQLGGSLQFVLTQDQMLPNLSKKLDKIIKKYKLEKSITFTGFLPKEDLKKLQRTCTTAILNKPSNWQNDYNFSTKLGEYLMSGIPVIASATGEMKFYLSDFETAFLIPPNDSESIAEKIIFIVKHPEIAKKVGEAGRQLALKEFYYLNHSKELVDFLKLVVDQ